MLLRDILARKGTDVYTIRPDASLDDVVRKLVQCNCGSLLVCDEGLPRRMRGIITERDIMRACAQAGGPLDRRLVQDCMSADVLTATPDQSVEETMGQMTMHRIRHLPIVEGDELVGIISIGDVVKAQFDALTMENHYLRSYLQG